jgi:hypothetical protein
MGLTEISAKAADEKTNDEITPRKIFFMAAP